MRSPSDASVNRGQQPGDSHSSRVLIITHAAPRSHTGNAGQNYLSARVREWQRTHDVRCLLLQGRSAREDLDETVCPVHILQRAPRGRLLQATSDRIRRTFPGVADPAVSLDLRHDPVAGQWLAEADIVVLEWQELAGHTRTIRNLAPKARILGVFHDVVSQSIQRKRLQATTLKERFKFTVAGWCSRLSERWIAMTADVTIVLSEKDAALLPSGRARTAIVPPAISAPEAPNRDPLPGTLMMVAGWRQEDVTGVDWFVNEVLPLVHAQGFRPNLHLIGRIPEELRSRWSQPEVRVEGFVEDLAAWYAQTCAAVVPLQLGAGVKFKTLEAIFHHVPIVTTEVGAEGIIGLTGTSIVSHDAAQFATRICNILDDQDSAQREADALAEAVDRHHSVEAFRIAALAALA